MFKLLGKYSSIEIKPDVFDKDLCNINTIEIVEEFGKYSFEQKNKTIQKNKLEKILQEIINILNKS